jgi:leucyl aminopeptidase
MAQKDSGKEKLVIEGQELIKRLGFLPPNKLTPKLFAKEAVAIGRKNKIKTTILSEKQMQKMGMGGVLAVSKGSSEEAQGIILDYHPRGAKKTIGLAGKGVTFDSGGLSLKHSRNMHEMKYDMLGGATAIAVLELAAKLKLPHRVVTMVIASENLPSGTATRPGDVITLLNGTTVEVINTDAEGRLVLADSLTFLQNKFNPGVVIDIATLTHGITATLGNKITGIYGTDKTYNQLFTEAAKASGEPVHFLPLFDDYTLELHSPVADLRNVSPKSRFDTVLGALFLKQFIKPKTPWLHIDIGGTAFNNDGPTGVMVKTLVEFLRSI